jgi:hypothetical protein
MISGEAHADDRPRLLPGLSDTIGDVLDGVLPDQPERQTEQQPKDKDKGSGKNENSSKGQPDTPVRDVIDKVKDEVEDTVGKVEDIVTAPAQEAPASDAQPDTPVAAPNDDTDPASDTELPDQPDPTPATNQTPPAPSADLGQAYKVTAAPDHDHRCGREPSDRSEPARERRTVQIAVLRHATPALPGYTQPTRPAPSGPDHDVTPAVGAASTPTIGLDTTGVITARAPMPRTTSVRIPGRDQAADGMTCRPDAPSG